MSEDSGKAMETTEEISTAPANPHKNKSSYGACLYLLLVSLVLLMIFSFGANGLNTDSIWTDELYSINNIGGFDPPYGPRDIIDSLRENSPDHVPLFYLLLAAWAQLAGWWQLSLRLFSVLAGMLMIAWLYRFTCDFFCRATALVAVVLMGTSAYMVLYFHDIRMYTLLLLFGLIHCWLYWRIVHGSNVNRRSWLWFVLSAVGLLYTHFFAFFVFALLGIYHVAFVDKSRKWLRLLLAWGASAVLFLPYLPTLISAVQLASANEKVTVRAASANEIVLALAKLLGNGEAIVLVIFVGMIVVALVFKRNAHALRLTIVSIAVLALIILLNEVVGIIPVSRMRYFLVLWIPIIILFAHGVSVASRRHWITVLLLFAWVLGGFQFYRSKEIENYIGGMIQTRNYPPMQNYVFHVWDHVRPQDFVLGFSHIDLVNNNRKFGNSVADYYTQALLGIDGAFIPNRWHEQRLLEKLDSSIDNHPYLLFTYNPQRLEPNFDDVSAYLAAHYLACDVVVDVEDVYVQRYAHPLAGCDRVYQPILFDNGITIVDRLSEFDEENNVVRLVTGWEISDESQLEQYNISLQILDSNREKYWQDDWHLYNRILKWHEVEMVPTRELEPGYYRAVVILYDRFSGEKVQGIDLTSGERISILPLVTFSVEP